MNVFNLPRMTASAQPAVITELSVADAPENSVDVVKLFNSHSLPVVLLLTDPQGYPTKVSVPFSQREALSSPQILQECHELENDLGNSLKELGFSIREVYIKSPVPYLKVGTLNFVLDRT